MCCTCLSSPCLSDCPERDDLPEYDDREMIEWELAVNDVLRALPKLGETCPVCQQWPCGHMRAARLALMALDCFGPLVEP